MAYNFRYINKIEQFNCVGYTLILEDEDGIMPEIRNDKNFCKDKYPNLSETDLYNEAQKDIAIYTEIYLENQIINS